MDPMETDDHSTKHFSQTRRNKNNKSNCFGFSTHQVTASNWTQDQIHFGLRVIDVTNRVNRNFPDLDIGALIGASRSNQKDLSYKPTWSVILIQIGSSENWIHAKLGSEGKVIQLLKWRMPDLPYLEAHRFRRLQTRLWRPGETSKRSRDIIHVLEASPKVLQCSSTQRIRRILLHLNLPYLDMFTLGAFKPQRLLTYPRYCVLRLDTMHLDVPRQNIFTPKLSRLKHIKTFHFGQDHHLSPTALCLYVLRFSCHF